MSSGSPELSLIERASLGIGRLANESALGKRLQYFWHYHVNRNWVREAVGRRLYVDGIDKYFDLHPDRGIMMASNHRSFYDQWINMLAIYELGRHHPAHKTYKMYFPVRSNFFYDEPVGMLVNTVIGAWSMYPPIFRDTAKAGLTKDGLDRLTHFLADPLAVVGVHPEGTRGKGPDPYEMLKAQPGTGQMILQGQPIVMPFFINGVENKPKDVLSSTASPRSRRDHPIILVYGDPIDYEDLAAKPPRATLYLKMANRVRQAIIDLMPREKEIRAACAAGEIDNSDPSWLTRAYPWVE